MKTPHFIAFVILAMLAAAAFQALRVRSPDPAENPARNEAADYVFAVSWQPAFCETRPNRPECRSQRGNRFDAQNFSLHGLWPQPAGNLYCNVPPDLVALDKSGRWRNLPRLDLSAALRKELGEKMPGYRSFLHRHEWFKHGTCMRGASPQSYFETSLALLDALNASDVAKLFRSRTGREVSFRDVSASLDRSFGRGAGKRLEMDCYRTAGRRLVGQLEFSLFGTLDESPDFRALVLAGQPEPRSCPSGIVDRAGPQ